MTVLRPPDRANVDRTVIPRIPYEFNKFQAPPPLSFELPLVIPIESNRMVATIHTKKTKPIDLGCIRTISLGTKADPIETKKSGVYAGLRPVW